MLYHPVVLWNVWIANKVDVFRGECVQNAVPLERETVKGNDVGDELIQPIVLREVYRGGYENNRMVGVIELETVPIDEAGGSM